MAGHSKWANIRFRKGAQDARRGKIFTKLIREISIAARMGGGEEDTNPRLRDAINKALKSNMKRDTIDNAIKRGVGGLDNDNVMELRYEGYGPGGVAILVDCMSDNKNRTVSDVRHLFTKHGGNLGTDGSVAYLFTHQGEILLEPNQPEDAVIEVAIESGAEDVVTHGGQIEVITTAENYVKTVEALRSAQYGIENSELTMHAKTRVPLDKETAESVVKLLDALEELDDVQTVHCNADYPEDFFEATE